MKEIFNDNFLLMGTNYHKRDAQNVVKKIGKVNFRWNIPDDELKNYIRKTLRPVYRYSTIETEKVTLEREPTNKHDANAIKVLVEGVFAGYVPSEIAGKINIYLKNPKRYKIQANLEGRGGECKSLSSDLKKLEKERKNISFYLQLTIFDTQESLLSKLFGR